MIGKRSAWPSSPRGCIIHRRQPFTGDVGQFGCYFLHQGRLAKISEGFPGNQRSHFRKREVFFQRYDPHTVIFAAKERTVASNVNGRLPVITG